MFELYGTVTSGGLVAGQKKGRANLWTIIL